MTPRHEALPNCMLSRCGSNFASSENGLAAEAVDKVGRPRKEVQCGAEHRVTITVEAGLELRCNEATLAGLEPDTLNPGFGK
ncbi:MAG: hypothetical protein ACPGYK_08825 [Flavobacteriales bacterium]